MKSLLLAQVMPPGGMLSLIVIGLSLCSWRWRRTGMALSWAGAIGLYVLATPVVSQYLLIALQRNLPAEGPAGHPPGAIVILGGERLITLNPPRGGRPGPLTMEGVQTGAALARRTGLPILVSGGGMEQDAAAVAPLMAESLKIDFGTPPRWVEDKSVDT